MDIWITPFQRRSDGWLKKRKLIRLEWKERAMKLRLTQFLLPAILILYQTLSISLNPNMMRASTSRTTRCKLISLTPAHALILPLFTTHSISRTRYPNLEWPLDVILLITHRRGTSVKYGPMIRPLGSLMLNLPREYRRKSSWKFVALLRTRHAAYVGCYNSV